MYRYDEVREYLAASVDTWFGDYNIDGVRIDSAHSLPPDFLKQVTRHKFPVGPLYKLNTVVP